MKRILSLFVCCCVVTSLAFGDVVGNIYFGNVPVERRNYILEKQSQLGYLVPSLLCSGVSYWLWVESDKPKNEDHRLGIRIISGSFAFVGLLFFGWALTPKKTFWFPKLGEDGKTIWFEKEVEW